MAQRYQLLIRDRHGFERTVPITRSVTVGRQSLCDVVLSDNMISRNHLRLELQEDTWWAEDLQTTHGSFYLNKPLGRAAWEPGTPLQLADGAYTLTLVRTDHSSSEIHLQAILDAAQLLAQEVDLEDMLEQSLDRLLSISGTDRGFLMLLEEGELASRVQRNLGQELEGQIQLSMSSVHKVFETGDPIWILNVAEDGQLLSQHSVQRLELKTILCLPLLLQGRRIGVVYLDSRRPVWLAGVILALGDMVDSACVLVESGSDGNLFGGNDMTHGGDGFFGFAGREEGIAVHAVALLLPL